jgi:hypothetical protein
MKSFPAEEELVAAYWQKLVSSMGAAYKSPSRVFARHATRGFQTHRDHASHRGTARVTFRRRAH